MQPAQTLDDSTLLAAYNRQANQIRSMHVEALMQAPAAKKPRGGRQQWEIPVLLDLVQPDLLRITGSLPSTSSRGFEMASDGREFRFLLPENGRRRFLVGPADAPPQSENPQENLRPQPILDAMLWRKGRLSDSSAPPIAGSGDRTVAIDLPRSRTGDETGEIVFDLRQGIVRSLILRNAAGTVVSEARYSDWQTIDSLADGPGKGCFPRHIQFHEPAGNYEITLRILRIVFNADIPKSAFQLSPPQGVPVVPLLGAPAKENR
jgi:hypothetical protein